MRINETIDRQCLSDAGFDWQTAEDFLHAQGDRERQLCLLCAQREKVLGKLHACRHKLECLDYLIRLVRRGDK